MSIKIYISPSNQPNNHYVVGNTNEKVQMEDVSKRIKSILDSEYECEAVMATITLGIGIGIDGRPKEAKNRGCGVYLAIHSNAGGGGTAKGAVGFYHPKSLDGKILATSIVEELGAICPVKSNRRTSVESGMKAYNGKGFGEIRNPSRLGLIAVLAETDFHDNPKTAQWILSSKDAIARAYVNALVKTFRISRKKAADSSTVTIPRYYRVQVGAYSKKANAEAMAKKLRSAGFDTYVKFY
ncbi:MAG: N-acetylmuramoyl-L-alanine amidase [Desulfosporosinus sp.]|nr:N-acetylmuramoyl-L-alanine amidase [Desulfosporosinus sp.]